MPNESYPNTLEAVEALLDSAGGRWPLILTCVDYPLDCNGHCQAASREGAREWMLGHAAEHGGSGGFGMWHRPDPADMVTLEGQ